MDKVVIIKNFLKNFNDYGYLISAVEVGDDSFRYWKVTFGSNPNESFYYSTGTLVDLFSMFQNLILSNKYDYKSL